MNKKYLIIISIVFILFSLLIASLSFLDSFKENFQLLFLHLINIILFLLSILAFFMHQSAIQAKTNIQFTSKTISVTAIKMLAIVISVISYVLFSKQSISVPSLLIIFALYFIYNFFELFFLLRNIKKNQP